MAHLASFIAGCELFKLTLHRGYSTIEFRDDLKKVFLQAGVKGEKMVFLLTDADTIKVSLNLAFCMYNQAILDYVCYVHNYLCFIASNI